MHGVHVYHVLLYMLCCCLHTNTVLTDIQLITDRYTINISKHCTVDYVFIIISSALHKTIYMSIDLNNARDHDGGSVLGSVTHQEARRIMKYCILCVRRKYQKHAFV